MPSSTITHTLGVPRIGAHRELKKATESYWVGSITQNQLEDAARQIRQEMWKSQYSAGVDRVTTNDFSFYDRMLDMSCLLGAIPTRFRHLENDPLALQFAMARGIPAPEGQASVPACEMTKWFDTNYHYIVPELDEQTTFSLHGDKPWAEFSEAKEAGFHSKPVLVGPLTFLALSKPSAEASLNFQPTQLMERIVPVYTRILERLCEAGAEWIEMDEPAFSLDLDPTLLTQASKAYQTLATAVPQARLLVANYFGNLGASLQVFTSLPVHGLHIDLTRAPNEFQAVLDEVKPSSKILSLGLVDGRNIWRCDYGELLPLLNSALHALGMERLWLAPSCSLQHVPWSLRNEDRMDLELRSWLAFAEEKMREVAFLRDWLEGRHSLEELKANQEAIQARQQSPRIHNAKVQERLRLIQPKDLQRISPYPTRKGQQQKRMQLPVLPTTTIGSFPQTTEVRNRRSRWKKGEISLADYEEFLRQEIAKCVRFQEEAGLDMLVHGEFERNDMVEYFGEQLNGFAFTQNGWVQSYGTRCVKPPLIYGDVSRPRSMTTRWSSYAQSLTSKPMKGMLTGPITMLQWSFVRDDQPRKETAFQIALALRDECLDLEQTGLPAIQVDEPALREGLPLRHQDWESFLQWAVDAFRLCTSGVQDQTQIHTHMCYAEFGDILDAITRMDADVITLEAARSGQELLGQFAQKGYPNGIGPGIYDIHSPRIPTVAEMADALALASRIFARDNLWANPDCGLKTRGWKEVTPSLRNLVEAARQVRQSFMPQSV
ncbi:MAG TPA: 5-methyltetrahydropteroyltriglutamate--homocysteine S-methyltransferase [Fibrobacteraceae bacterium]|nr:5-methyltetrahydropteroyltriglutamate--homocysteine S-methyltransferase [Fibrobacteraceae bacterium]